MNQTVKRTLIAVRKNPEGPYIFCNKDGKPFTSVWKSFSTALKKSGIKNFRFHDCRHSFASHLVMSGVDLNTVRELLGHRTLEMTLRYAHLSPDHKRRAVELLTGRLEENTADFDPYMPPKQTSDIKEETEKFITV